MRNSHQEHLIQLATGYGLCVLIPVLVAGLLVIINMYASGAPVH